MRNCTYIFGNWRRSANSSYLRWNNKYSGNWGQKFYCFNFISNEQTKSPITKCIPNQNLVMWPKKEVWSLARNWKALGERCQVSYGTPKRSQMCTYLTHICVWVTPVFFLICWNVARNSLPPMATNHLCQFIVKSIANALKQNTFRFESYFHMLTVFLPIIFRF